MRDSEYFGEALMFKGKLAYLASIITVLFTGIMVGVFFHYLMHRLILSTESFIYLIF